MTVQWRCPCVVPVCFVITCAALPVKAEDTEDSRLVDFEGSYRAVFDYEQDEIDGDDLDFKQYLRLNLHPFFHEKAAFHFYGRVRADIDSDTVTDKALSQSDHRVFQAYAELDGMPARTRVRLGRQWIHEVEGVHVDGARAEVMDWSGVDFMAFGGRAVSAYSSTEGHEVIGGAAGYRPFRGALLRLTGVWNDEENPITDDEVGLYWLQRVGETSRFHADYKILNRRGKEFRLGASTFIPAWQTELLGNYYRRVNRSPIPERDDVFGRRFSEFHTLLGEVEELDRYGLTGTRYFADRFALSGGCSLIDIRGRENPANRDTERYFLAFHFYDLLLEHMDVSITGNYIHAELESQETQTVEYTGEQVTKEYERDEETFLITGEARYRISPAARVSVGSAYGDFDFSSSVDLDQAYSQEFLDTQLGWLVSGLGGRFITRTYFAEFRWRIRKELTARFLAELDHSKISANNDTDDYVRLVTGLTYTF